MKNKLTETIVRLSAFVLSLSFVLAAGANAQNSPPVAIDDFYGVDQLAALNEPAPGVLVNDSDADVSNTLTAALVTGPSHARSFQLNSNGSFTYVPVADYYGPDTFTYHASDGTLSSETGTVNITVRQPCSTGGFITGGGKFFQDGRKCTFGFVAKVQGAGAQGNLEFQDHDMGLDVKAGTWIGSTRRTRPTDTSAARASEPRDGYSYFVQVHDRGQPGNNDDFSVWIYDSNGAQVYTSGGLLSGGNIRIHETAATVTPPIEWFFDCDWDGYTVPAGESCTPPPCRALSPECDPQVPCCPQLDPESGHDCNDNDEFQTQSCDSRKSCGNWLRLLGMIPLSSRSLWPGQY